PTAATSADRGRMIRNRSPKTASTATLPSIASLVSASTRANASGPRTRASSSTPSMALSVLSQSKRISLEPAMGKPDQFVANRARSKEKPAPAALTAPSPHLRCHTFAMALTKPDVISALRTCQDPEIPVNIVDLGLVYDIVLTPSA